MAFLLISIIVAVYSFLSFPVISTGDGAGLATSSYTLGLAHPPGYPLYLQINKLFSFLPIGNIGERMIIASVFFSALSLILLYRTLKLITGDKWFSLFGVALVSLTYSFLGQSVVLKFYPLNLFIVSVLIYIGTYTALKGFRKELVYISAFILGLSSGNHHTALFMAIPLLLLFLSFGFKALPVIFKSSLFFVLGFSVNIYAIIRSYKDSSFLFMPTKDFESFLYMFLRKGYGSSASLEAVSGGVAFLEGYLFAVKNLSFIFMKNFTYAGLVLFILGIVFLFMKGSRLWVFLMSSFFMLGIFLAKITLGIENPDVGHLYITAHQYYMPAFYIFALIASLPIAYLYKHLRSSGMELVPKLVPPLALVFPFLFIFDRLLDQNFGRNYVPYSYGKVVLGTMPLYSFYITIGDNAIFQSWYLNTLSGFRRDICNVEIPPEESSIYLRGCQPSFMYKKTHRAFFGGNMRDFSERGKLFSSAYIGEDNFLSKVFKPKFLLFYYALLPKDEVDKHIRWLEDRFLYNQKYTYIPYEDCIIHRSDDHYTINLCKLVSYNFAMASKILEKRTLFSLSKPNEAIDRLMNMYFAIAQHNDLSKSFYYTKKEKGNGNKETELK